MGIFASLLGNRAPRSFAVTANGKRSSEYRCVEIVADEGRACAAARAIAGRRFLADEIPRLPLPACTREACECSYELLDDRRSESRHDSVPVRRRDDGRP